MNCVICNQPIPPERIEALPDTKTCVQHSGVSAYQGFMVSEFSKGTAPALVMVPQNRESLRKAHRAHKRSR